MQSHLLCNSRYKKLQYERKNDQKSRTKVETKEIQLKINISDHDLQTKVNNINKFISKEISKVKMVVRLKGHEKIIHRAHELLEKAYGLVEVGAKRLNFQLSCNPLFEPAK